MIPLKKLLIRIAIVTLIIVPGILSGQNSSDYSEAQMLLFANQHLQNIDRKATLYYDFRQSGSDTNEINDLVTIEIVNIEENGRKDIQPVFLSGDNHRAYNKIENFRSNPLIMLFLQWDVEKMDSTNKVLQDYFRYMIRNAFVNEAKSSDITLSYAGNRIAGKHISLEPFKGVDDTDKYRNFMNKRYEFFLSKDVPGGIHSIKTIIPGGNNSEDEPSERAEMIFSRVRPEAAFVE